MPSFMGMRMSGSKNFIVAVTFFALLASEVLNLKVDPAVRACRRKWKGLIDMILAGCQQIACNTGCRLMSRSGAHAYNHKTHKFVSMYFRYELLLL